MNQIPKSYRYLLAFAAVLLTIPVIAALIISKQIKNKQSTVKENYKSPVSIIPVPQHSILMVDSYEQRLNFYAWWSDKEDTLMAKNFNDIISNKHYFSQGLSGDTFSIQYLPVLKKFIANNAAEKSDEYKKNDISTNEISMIGKAPDEMVIRGGNVQILPLESSKPITYKVEEGSLALGALMEDMDHFKNLTQAFPGMAIGINYQPDYEHQIVSPATIHLSPRASLFIKEGYNTVQIQVISLPNSFINIEHSSAHKQIKWQLSDSTYIHCNQEQEVWFRATFPSKKLIFTINETAPFSLINKN